MKKRIFIILIVIAVCAVIALPLYFFVFKAKDLTQEQSINLIVRAGIDIGAIEDYEKAPVLGNLKTGSGDNNIINCNELPSLIEISLLNQTWDLNEASEKSGILNDLINHIYSFMKIKNLEQNKVYTTTELGNVIKITYKIVGNEILFIETITGSQVRTVFTSVFYDSEDNEYEFVCTEKDTLGNFIVHRYKANSEGLISCEVYSLSGITSEKILIGINNGEGASSIEIFDYKNKTCKISETLNKNNSPDDHFVLSSYVYQIYSNFEKSLQESLTAIEKETKPTVYPIVPPIAPPIVVVET